MSHLAIYLFEQKNIDTFKTSYRTPIFSKVVIATFHANIVRIGSCFATSQLVDGVLYEVLKVSEIPLDYSSIAQLVEHAAVNRAVVGSSPTRGVFLMKE